jgi:hypothetical protein
VASEGAVVSEVTSGAGILPVEIQSERVSSDGRPKAWCSASAWSARRRCSAVIWGMVWGTDVRRYDAGPGGV